MTATLSLSEIMQEKRATEQAIAKILSDLQRDTGAYIHGIALTKLIGDKGTKTVSVQIDIIF